MQRVRHFGLALLLAGLLEASLCAVQTFQVATYNLNNYLLEPVGTRPAKTSESKKTIQESLRVLNADVVAMQEVGGTNALLELRQALKEKGLDYPHWDLSTGADTNIQVGLLSKFPIVGRVHHTNCVYLLQGRRFRVSRGFLEAKIQVNPSYQFTLINCHLKSRLAVSYGDETEMREAEAALLRERVDTILKSNPNANLMVVGDCNDVKASLAIRTLIGKGRLALVDTRPTERNGDDRPSLRQTSQARNIAWTYYYSQDDTYSRIDYLLVSRGLAREWKPEGTYVLAVANWGKGSDHRPITAAFEAQER